MQSQRVLRILVIGIVGLVAATLLGSALDIGRSVVSFGMKALLVLLLVAIVVRFLAVLDDKRRPF